MANNSSGARSVLYGKTIDHVLEQDVVLADGSLAHFGPVDDAEAERRGAAPTLEGACYRAVVRAGARTGRRDRAAVSRRSCGASAATTSMSSSTRRGRSTSPRCWWAPRARSAWCSSAKVNLVPLPKAKAVLAIQFHDLLEALAATPVILRARAFGRRGDGQVHPRLHAPERGARTPARSSFIVGDPGALLCVEFYGDRAEDLPPRMRARRSRTCARAASAITSTTPIDLPAQARIWSLREAALGLSMAMKDDAKSISFVEDTAVAPERLRDYIERFLALVRRPRHHGRRLRPRLGRLPARAARWST